MTDLSKMKLGKHPAQKDPKALMLAKYLTLPPIPAAVDYAAPVPSWPMMANDRLGDCTCAAMGHTIEGMTTDAGTPFIPTDDQVVAAYSAVSGYNPTTGKNDNGATCLSVLKYWAKTGLGGHVIKAFATIGTEIGTISQALVKSSVYLFGSTYVGLLLPLTAQTQDVWDVVSATGDGAPGSWGGHAVPVVGYDAEGLTFISWGAVRRMTWAFFATYCVAPATKVLTDDLRWVQAGDVPVGAGLLSFDEKGPYRRWKRGVVQSTRIIKLPCQELTFADGTVVVCSKDHRWLTHHHGGTYWIRTDRMRVGGRFATKVVRPLSVWTTDLSREAGYVAAAFDGEGHLSQQDISGRGVGVARVSLGFSQKDNAMRAEMFRCLKALNIKFTVGKDRKDGVGVISITERPELLRVLGSIRPLRLLAKFNPNLLGMMGLNNSQRVAVIARRDVGLQDVVAIKTDAQTFLAEGLASHNCDEAYTVLSKDWIDKTGLAVSNFNFAQLSADLADQGPTTSPKPTTPSSLSTTEVVIGAAVLLAIACFIAFRIGIL